MSATANSDAAPEGVESNDVLDALQTIVANGDAEAGGSESGMSHGHADASKTAVGKASSQQYVPLKSAAELAMRMTTVWP